VAKREGTALGPGLQTGLKLLTEWPLILKGVPHRANYNDEETLTLTYYDLKKRGESRRSLLVKT